MARVRSSQGNRAGLRLLRWLPAVAWAALIFGLSAQPDLRFAPDPAVDYVVRKLGHMAEFGILASLIWLALTGATSTGRLAKSFAGAVVYAATDEFHQALVSGRNASAVDVGFDALGAVIVVVGIATIGSRRGGRN